MGVPDPTSPGHFWVEHPAPGPHVGAGVAPTVAATPLILPQTPAWVVPATVAASPWVPANTLSTPPAWVRQFTPTVMLNPQLCVNIPSPYYPPLVWDMAHLPAQATLRHVTGRNLVVPIQDKDFKDAAVYPPGLAVHVHLSHNSWPFMLNAWGPIVANPHGKDNKVTVWDVLDAVYNYLQKHLDWQEVCDLAPCGPDDENYRRIGEAFKERCRTADSLEEYERSQGLRRVDILGDERRWCGKLERPWKLWRTHRIVCRSLTSGWPRRNSSMEPHPRFGEAFYPVT